MHSKPTTLIISIVFFLVGCSKNDSSQETSITTAHSLTYEAAFKKIEAQFPAKDYITNAPLLAALQEPAYTGEKTKIDIGLAWVRNDQFAPVYLAELMGYFAEENLEPNIIPGSLTTDGMTLLMSKKIDFSIASAGSNLISLLIANRKNDPGLVAIGSILRKHPFAFIRIDSSVPQDQKSTHIMTADDFRGKIIGTDPKGQYLTHYAMGKLGVSMDEITTTRTANSIEPLTMGTFDVMSAWMDNIPRMLEERGYNNWNAWVFAEEGWPDQGNVLITRQDTIEHNPELVKRFLRAIHKGLAYMMENPEAASIAVEKYLKDHGSSLTQSLILKRFQFQTQFAQPEQETDPLLLMNEDKWNQTAAIMLQYGSIDLN